MKLCTGKTPLQRNANIKESIFLQAIQDKSIHCKTPKINPVSFAVAVNDVVVPQFHFISKYILMGLKLLIKEQHFT